MTSDNPTCPFCQALAGAHLPYCIKYLDGTTVEEREAVAPKPPLGPLRPMPAPRRKRWFWTRSNLWPMMGLGVYFTPADEDGGPNLLVTMGPWNFNVTREEA